MSDVIKTVLATFYAAEIEEYEEKAGEFSIEIEQATAMAHRKAANC